MNAPTLTDERISTMRSSVMQSVDRDVDRRGRRTRRGLGLAAASALVLVTGTWGLTLVGAGGGDSADRATSSSQDSGAGDMAGATAPQGAAGNDAKAVAPDTARDVITTGEVNVTVKHPAEAAQRLSAYVESLGGRVDSRTQNGSGDDASAFVAVRVPSDRVTATIDRLKTYGTINHVSLQHQDVTAQARDLDARIDALDLSISRLQQIMSRADSSGELIKAESALTQRQEQLESLQAQRKTIADQVSLSTLSVDLSQSARADSVEPDGFIGGLTDGWNALVSTVNRLVAVAGVLLPWAGVVLALYVVRRLVARRRGRSART